MRYSVLAAIAALGMAACGPSEKETQAKIDEITNKAKADIATAQKAADAKIADAEKQVADLKTQLAEATTKATADAQEEIAKIKEESDKFAAEAQLALTRARSAYKDSANKQLQALSTEANTLSAQSKKAPAKSKAAVAKALKDITAKRTAVQKDIAAFDKATIEQLKGAKAKVDTELAQLKQLNASLRAKLPKD